MRRILLSAAVTILMVPSCAFAMQETVWDFTNSQVPGKWDVGGLETVTPTADGLHIVSSRQGQMVRQNDLLHPVDAVIIDMQSPQGVNAIFLWHPRNGDPGNVYQLPVVTEAGRQQVELNMIDFNAWDARADLIGMAFSPGSDVTLLRIRLQHWNVAERIGFMWQSFWKFDPIQPYSINFLWGPVLARTPLGLQNLFVAAPPPTGWSFNRILLPALGLAGAALWIGQRFARDMRSKKLLGLPAGLAVFLLLCAGSWLLWDLRMGLEMLSYAKTDYMQFISKEGLDREVRNFENIYDVIWELKPMLLERERYVILQPRGYPYNAIARYLTYPSVPLQGDMPTEGIRDWVVLERADVTVDGDGRLTADGKILTPPGKITKQLTNDMYLFQVTQ